VPPFLRSCHNYYATLYLLPIGNDSPAVHVHAYNPAAMPSLVKPLWTAWQMPSEERPCFHTSFPTYHKCCSQVSTAFQRVTLMSPFGVSLHYQPWLTQSVPQPQQGLAAITKFCSNHEIFITKINNFTNFECFTKFLCLENLELYGSSVIAPIISTICTGMVLDKKVSEEITERFGRGTVNS